MVMTGAGGGIMEAGNLGAGPDHSFGLNIQLPFEQGANPVMEGNPKLINFKYFFYPQTVSFCGKAMPWSYSLEGLAPRMKDLKH